MPEFDTDRSGSPDVIAGAFPPIAAPVVRVSSPRLVAGLAMTEVAKIQKELAAVTAERDRLKAFCEKLEADLLRDGDDWQLMQDVRAALGEQGPMAPQEAAGQHPRRQAGL